MNAIKHIISDKKLIIFFYLVTMANYFIIFFNTQNFIKLIFSVLIIATFFICILRMDKDNFHIKILILVFLVISLGSPTFHSDARIIWLFNAKRIFMDGNTYFLMDNEIGKLWFDTYPLLGPSVASAIANIFGYWNEVFPKAFSVILSMPPLLYLNSIIDKKINKIFFVLIVVFLLEKSLLMGEMDGLLALYFVVSAIISFQFIFTDNKNKFKKDPYNILMLIFTLAFLSLLKKEALILILIIFLSLLITNHFSKKNYISFKYMLIFCASLLPLIIWEIYLLELSIFIKDNSAAKNILSGDFKLIIKEIFNFKDILKINSKIIFNKHLVISIAFFTFAIGMCFNNFNQIIKNEFIKNTFIYTFLISIIYIGYLNVIYLLTAWDLDWHLSTSAARTALPLSLVLSITALLFLDKRNFILSKK